MKSPTKNAHILTTKSEEIDPLFCKAYGVSQNPKRLNGVYMSPEKVNEIDQEYTKYLELEERTNFDKLRNLKKKDELQK